MAEEDVRRIMQHPTTMIASDGGIPAPGVGAPHPRSYGTFARVLGHYVRDEEVLALRTAIHKMTGFPAQRLGLTERGVLREGAIADIAVFDSGAITDQATFAEPHQFATGVVHVFVAGEAVLREGTVTGARPGRVLRAGGHD
jgi:dihydroorotase/N-acyl-D-amino-acid deacylase